MHPLSHLAISRFADGFKKGNHVCGTYGVLQNVNWIEASFDIGKMLKNYMVIPRKSLCSLMILPHYTVPLKIKLTVSTGSDKQGDNWEDNNYALQKPFAQGVLHNYPLKQQTECNLFDEFVPQEISQGTLTQNFGLKTQVSILESLRIKIQVLRIGVTWVRVNLLFSSTEFTYPNVRDAACTWNLYIPFNLN